MSLSLCILHDVYFVLVRDNNSKPLHTSDDIVIPVNGSTCNMIGTNDLHFYLGFVCPGSGDVCHCGQLSTPVAISQS